MIRLFRYEEDRDKRRMIDDALRVTFWKNLRLEDGYYQKIQKTFTSFWKPQMASMSKEELHPKLSEYISILKDIKFSKYDNLLGLHMVALEGKDEYERMELYVEFNYLKDLFGVDTDRSKVHKRQREILFQMNGNTISNRKRYKIKGNFLGTDVNSSDIETCDDDFDIED